MPSLLNQCLQTIPPSSLSNPQLLVLLLLPPTMSEPHPPSLLLLPTAGRTRFPSSILPYLGRAALTLTPPLALSQQAVPAFPLPPSRTPKTPRSNAENYCTHRKKQTNEKTTLTQSNPETQNAIASQHFPWPGERYVSLSRFLREPSFRLSRHPPPDHLQFELFWTNSSSLARISVASANSCQSSH